MTTTYRSFQQARTNLTARFKTMATKVVTEKWQGQDVSKRPDMVSWELMNESFMILLFGIEKLDHWKNDIKPNLPWADDHFLERVCGAPLNPGVQWANWPWATSADKHRKDEMFNHTYMERLWPRFAGVYGATKTIDDFWGYFSPDTEARGRYGIREPYGDLNTLVDKLATEPHTRQAYIPLYFPEDTGAEGRMPCTLGYQFMVRDNRLHIWYPLRSCDFVRHWADDCYLAVRLLLWVLDECRKINPWWNDVKPGSYKMDMMSFHIFENDYRSLK